MEIDPSSSSSYSSLSFKLQVNSVSVGYSVVSEYIFGESNGKGTGERDVF